MDRTSIDGDREAHARMVEQRREQQRQELVRLESLRRRQAVERCLDALRGVSVE